MKRKRIVLLILLGVVVIVLASGAWYLAKLMKYKSDVEAIHVQNIDLSTVKDGEYTGECDVGYIRAKVLVVVKAHVIKDVKLLEHYNERGAPAEAIPQKILDEQRIDVDAISGATSSSKVIEQAVYNALTGKSG